MAIIALSCWKRQDNNTATMPLPRFVEQLEGDGFPALDVNAAPLKGYVGVINWMKNHIRENGLLETEDGNIAEGTFPWPNSANEATDIKRAVNEVAWRINGREWPRHTTAQTMIKKTLVLVHPDQHNKTGPRVHYAASACTAFLDRCAKALVPNRSDRLPDLLPMPNVLITNFTASQALIYPPSGFEYVAAKRSKNRPANIGGVKLCNQRWEEIEAARADAKVKEAESRFWLTHWFDRRPLERDIGQIYFASYVYDTIVHTLYMIIHKYHVFTDTMMSI